MGSTECRRKGVSALWASWLFLCEGQSLQENENQNKVNKAGRCGEPVTGLICCLLFSLVWEKPAVMAWEGGVESEDLSAHQAGTLISVPRQFRRTNFPLSGSSKREKDRNRKAFRPGVLCIMTRVCIHTKDPLKNTVLTSTEARLFVLEPNKSDHGPGMWI